MALPAEKLDQNAEPQVPRSADLEPPVGALENQQALIKRAEIEATAAARQTNQPKQRPAGPPPPADNIVYLASYRQEKERQRNLSAAKRQDQQQPESEIAKEYGAGPAMEGVSESAGLTGGSSLGTPAVTPAATAQPTPENQPPPSPVVPQGQDTSTATPQAAQQRQRQNTVAATRQAIGMQQQQLNASRERAQSLRGQADQASKEKRWGRSLTQLRAKRAEKQVKKDSKKLDKLGEELGAQLGSGMLLKAAWLNLIDTFGLSWFYIAFHFLAAYFTPFSSLFVKFGEEWIPKAAQGKAAAVKAATKPLELLEIIGCFLIGLLMAVIIILLVVILIILVYAYMHPISTLYQIAKIDWTVIKCVGTWVFGGSGEACVANTLINK